MTIDKHPLSQELLLDSVAWHVSITEPHSVQADMTIDKYPLSQVQFA